MGEGNGLGLSPWDPGYRLRLGLAVIGGSAAIGLDALRNNWSLEEVDDMLSRIRDEGPG